MAERETKPMAFVLGVARFAVVFGTLAALAYLAFDLVSIAFRLGPRMGLRSTVGVALPMLAGGYAAVSRGGTPDRLRRLPIAVPFAASFVAGALALAAIPHFLALMPLPIAELAIASCIAMLAVAARRALDASQPGSIRSLALFLGVAAGMLLYVAAFGIPRVVPG